MSEERVCLLQSDSMGQYDRREERVYTVECMFLKVKARGKGAEEGSMGEG